MKYTAKQNEKLIKSIIHNVQGVSFSFAQKALRKGDIKVNGLRVKDNIDVKPNDEIDVFISKKSIPNVDVIYEDENVIIVNKPQGLECREIEKSSENTYSLEEIFKDKNAKIVHRLDRLTEGLVIMAKSSKIATLLNKSIENREIIKSYKALVEGTVKDEGIKTAYLKKDAVHSKVTISDCPKADYKKIVTEYSVDKIIDNNSLLNIVLHTGRTHQIRAYFSHIGHAVINDTKYGNPFKGNYNGYYLTAYKLQFNLKNELSYLNDKVFEISPSWI